MTEVRALRPEQFRPFRAPVEAGRTLLRQPGRLLATGRDADIFEAGPGLVLKRSRSGHAMRWEASLMDHARAHGYPAPAVEEVSEDGQDVVMERLDGVSMLDTLGRKPWTVRRQGAVLARLHRQLHDIPPPDWLPAAPFPTPGDAFLHLDLHPLNVMLTTRGPVVIDWPNARRGDPATDVALTWVLMTAGEVPASRVKAKLMGAGRALLVNSFLGSFDRDAIARRVPEVVEWKLTDDHMSPAEQDRMRRLAARS